MENKKQDNLVTDVKNETLEKENIAEEESDPEQTKHTVENAIYLWYVKK